MRRSPLSVLCVLFALVICGFGGAASSSWAGFDPPPRDGNPPPQPPKETESPCAKEPTTLQDCIDCMIVSARRCRVENPIGPNHPPSNENERAACLRLIGTLFDACVIYVLRNYEREHGEPEASSLVIEAFTDGLVTWEAAEDLLGKTGVDIHGAKAAEAAFMAGALTIDRLAVVLELYAHTEHGELR